MNGWNLKSPHMLSSHPHESFRIRMEPAQVLGDEGRSKHTLGGGTAIKLTTTLPKEALSDRVWKFLLLSSSYPKTVPCPWPWHQRPARDRHVCVSGGCKVTWISRKIDKGHWWCFVASYELECNVSPRCWRETIAQTIYWRSRRIWKISVFYKRSLQQALLRDIALVASQSNTY